jgi:hypothetical protein
VGPGPGVKDGCTTGVLRRCIIVAPSNIPQLGIYLVCIHPGSSNLTAQIAVDERCIW